MVFTWLFISISALANTQSIVLKEVPNKTVIESLFAKAVRLSGIPPYPIEEMPKVYRVSEADLNRLLCPNDPANCRKLGAVFDNVGYRFLLRDNFNITDSYNPFDDSFLLHEIVHSLQYRARGPAIFDGCTAIRKTEQEAYLVQNRFLKEEGQFFNAYEALRGFYCNEEEAHKDYLESLAIWESRQAKNNWREVAAGLELSRK